MKARVYVTLKRGVLDPQGRAVQHALQSLGFSAVKDVRVGKFIELDLEETDARAAEESLRQMGQRLLANTVIEDFRVEVVEVSS